MKQGWIQTANPGDQLEWRSGKAGRHNHSLQGQKGELYKKIGFIQSYLSNTCGIRLNRAQVYARKPFQGIEKVSTAHYLDRETHMLKVLWDGNYN